MLRKQTFGQFNYAAAHAVILANNELSHCEVYNQITKVLKGQSKLMEQNFPVTLFGGNIVKRNFCENFAARRQSKL